MKAEERLKRLSLQIDAHQNSLTGELEKLGALALHALAEIFEIGLAAQEAIVQLSLLLGQLVALGGDLG